MSASSLRILGLVVVSACLMVGCSEAKKIEVGGTCTLNSDCNSPLVCTAGKCHDACHTSADCPLGQSCIIASDQSKVCQLSAETHCVYASDCPPPLMCATDQQCRNQCQKDVDCPYGQTCTTTQTCAEPNQVDSNKNLFAPDGGVSGSGGASGAGGTGGTISPNPDASPDSPLDMSGSTGGVSSTGGSGGALGTDGSIGPNLDASADSPADVLAGTGGANSTGGVTSTGGATGAATGGATATGGAIPTGGSAPASGTPVAVSTFDISKFVGTPGMRLGDINGDGRMEIVMGQPMPQPGAYVPQQVVCVTAYDLKGKQLWQYGTPGTGHGASSDIPIQVYDLDGDGKSEVFAAMSTTEITVLDGTTGTLQRKIPLPATGSNDCIAFANLRGKGWPQDIIVKTRYSQFWAITGIDDATSKAGTLLWNQKLLPSDSTGSDLGTGHYPLVYDWDGDGKDEVMGGYFFFESDGTQVWTTNTTSSPKLTMHADCLATADVDGNPANGYEIVVGGNVAAMFDWKTGKQLWQDTNTVEVQQMGIGEYRSDSAGLEVVLLDRIGPRDATGVDANVLLSSTDKLIWKESRKDKGWITVTENMNNWTGDGTNLILSYHRGGQTPASLYDGNQNVVAQFPHSGSLVDLVQHANLCGDDKEEVIVFNESSVWIFANGGCNLDEPPAHPSIPQQFHLYNWSQYTGWITPDVRFYTPGSQQ
jgi:hypothetical protein